MLPESKTVIMNLAASASSAGLVFGKVDTKGYDYLTIDVLAGTVAAAETAVTTLQLGEADTPLTDITTDGSLIPAFTGAAATSATAGFVLPPASSTKMTVYRFNVDLRGRKRFIACDFKAAAQIAAGVAQVAHLSRAEEHPVMSTVATTVDGCRLVISG